MTTATAQLRSPWRPGPGLWPADLLLDADRLSDLVGRQVHATRLRHKPGRSTVAALHTGDGTPPGWVHVLTGGQPEKLDKVLGATRGHAHPVRHRVLPGHRGDLVLAWGGLDTDPRLHRALTATRRLTGPVQDALGTGRARLLRYNPQRRLVLHLPGPGGGGTVLRLTAGHQRRIEVLPAALHRAGIAVLHPLPRTGPTARPQLSAWPWYGAGTLADPPGAGDHTGLPARAGAQLAVLHRQRLDLPVLSTTDLTGTLDRLVTDLAGLDPDAAAAMADLTGRVCAALTAGSWPTGTVHGDWSADQVLHDGHGDLRLIDFDRAGTGPTALDLGSFAAVDLIEGADPGRTRAMIEGYRQAGGTVPAAGQLRCWTAHALLRRVLDPFRAGSPHWQHEVRDRLDQIEQVLR